jgi:hypothetical protein
MSIWGPELRNFLRHIRDTVSNEISVPKIHHPPPNLL